MKHCDKSLSYKKKHDTWNHGPIDSSKNPAHYGGLAKLYFSDDRVAKRT